MAHDHLFFPKLTTANGLPWLLLSKPLFFGELIIELSVCNCSLFFGKWELNGSEDQEIDPSIDSDIDPTEGNPQNKNKGWNTILKRKPNLNQAKPSKASK